MNYPTKEQQENRHIAAQEYLESLRSKIGDENFIKFIMGVLAVSKGCKMKICPETVVHYCENAAFLLTLYIEWYLESMKEKMKDEKDNPNVAAWNDIASVFKE